jgi:hypothetical protein
MKQLMGDQRCFTTLREVRSFSAMMEDDDMATYEGVGKTVDEAEKKAHDQIPKNPKTADEMIISKVVQWGRRTGGIAGVNEFYVIVERTK